MSRTVTIAAVAAAAIACLAPAFTAQAQRTPPGGTYQRSCTQISLSNGGILSAQCQTRAGRYAAASLNVANCGPGDIGNNDGRLICEPAFGRAGDGRRGDNRPGAGRPGDVRPGNGNGNGRGPGRGGYGPASIILYEAANYQGRSVELRGDIDRLDYEHFNDTASSIRVNGGEWQICTAAQYQGNCVVIRRDVPNMNQYQMNDQLSSLRRIG